MPVDYYSTAIGVAADAVSSNKASWPPNSLAPRFQKSWPGPGLNPIKLGHLQGFDRPPRSLVL